MTEKELEEIKYTVLRCRGGWYAAMKEWGDRRFIEGRDKALECASQNAKAKEDWYRGRLAGTYVDKDSILVLRFDKDLQP